MFIKLLIILFSLSLLACSTTKQSTQQTSSTVDRLNWAGEVNAVGYPIVAGKYLFSTSQFTFNCDNNNEGKSPAISTTVSITQNSDQLTIENTDKKNNPKGLSGFEDVLITGTLFQPGSFIASKIFDTKIQGYAGKPHLYYFLEGSFTPTGWSGNLSNDISFGDRFVRCTYQASFVGQKLSKILSRQNSVSVEF